MSLMLIGRIERIPESKAPPDGQEWWFVHCAAIGAWTQGHSRNDAKLMLADCVECHVFRKGFKVTVTEIGPTANGFDVLVDANHREFLAATVLLYQREKHRLSRERVARRLGVTVRTYAAYEEGRVIPSLEMLAKAIDVVAPELALVLGPRVVPATKASKRRRVTPKRRRAA